MTPNQHNSPATQSLICWDMTIKFIVLFTIGLFLALGFSFLLSLLDLATFAKETSVVLLVQNWESILSQNLFLKLYLPLTLAGVFGGLLCSVLVEEDKMLEFPSWAKNDKGLKPGFIGDIFVGFAGAFIAYIVLAEFLKDQPGATIFVVGLVGGYSGEYVMQAALKRLIARIKDADFIEERLETINQIETLQNLANRQIYQGLNGDELSELSNQLQSSSVDSEVKERIFETARDARRLGSRVKAYENRIKQTIPILEALVNSDPNNDRYHAQLACAYRDCIPPKLDEALLQFDQAIQKRNPTRANNWHYELDRVIALIYKASQQGESKEKNTSLSQKILNDLLTIDQNKGLTRIFEEFDQARKQTIQQWLKQNQNWLKQHPTGKQLLTKTALLSWVPSTEAPSSQSTSSVSSNGVTKHPVTRERTTQSILNRVPIPKANIVKHTITPERWDQALEKAFLISKGASVVTAKQDGLKISGISASQKMAQTDWPRIEQYVERFYKAAVQYDVPPALLAAIASRESRGGNILKNGWGDFQHGSYQGYGIMQVDKKSHTPNLIEGPGGQAHINQATKILATCRQQVQQKHPSWSDDYVLKGATAAYNFGPDDVQTKAGMDRGTTGNDYSSDVMIRAKFYATKLKSLAQCKAQQNQGLDQAETIVTPQEPQKTSMQKITALKDTFLKKQPIQNFQLSETQKLAVATGQSYGVEAYKDVGGGHYWVKLASNAGEWYIYDSERDGHWDTSWEGDETDTEGTITTNQAVGEIHNTPGAIDWSNGSLRISKYFTVAEVTKNDHRRRPKTNSAEEKNILALAKELDKIREDWGSGVIVNSWFRPSTKLGYPYDVNREQRGATNSQHIYGRAADIRPAKGGIYEFQKWLDRSWYGHLGWGAKKGFVHLDMRNGKGWKKGGTKGGRFPY
ncbi:D-Ala-D-Ala carboxypeptidase family metallohydrolase [Cyanothece sp. BG0011]|uniref:D-Ala-D-Ala carboxypeptidase family metallohydrolase n=1 Tax=Cyanothece sp. BG0011 TaxID=2082950 RepID=UPI000D1F0A10|nr:D-Ala-D-Ala carboxypeptidase family metallohydrolase [Cyanothece sp. BG0011]